MALGKVLLLAAVFASLATGCGGGNGDGGGGTGSDEDYVAGICSATRALERDSAEVLEKQSPLADTIHRLAPVVEDMGKALAKLHPPADLESFHKDYVSRVKRAAGQMEDWKQGDGDVFQALVEVQPPAEAAKRLDAVAANDPVCREIGFRFQGMTTGN